jgi:hypothetical protein
VTVGFVPTSPVTVTPLRALVRASGSVELVDESSALDDEPHAARTGMRASEAAKTPAAIKRGARREERFEIIGVTLGVEMD